MAVRDDFTAGEVLAAADLNDTFASKVDYALPVNAQTGTTYTFVAADAEKLTTASNGSAVTLTIPPQSSVTWSDNTVLRVVNYGAGAVTIDGGSGVTVTNTSSTIAQYGAAVAIRTGSDAWTVVPFGGGDVPAAEVSSPAATGQYTDGGGQTWDYFTFTASGTLTVDTAGFADVLVVGGGGSGGSRGGGGGGAGGHLYLTNAYIETGSLTVTVGAGGASVSPSADYGLTGNNGIPSRLGKYYAVGGGGGGALHWLRNNNTTYYANAGLSGGSGGGGSTYSTGSSAGGAGVSGLGNAGGIGAFSSGSGGGGGAAAVGGTATTGNGGNGGDGVANSITGTSVTRAGGGGGAATIAGAGGSGGGGAGTTGGTATSGTVNTGGGGGGSDSATTTSGNGGSGVVIVRVKV